jgi:hypothetical protein
MVVAWAKVLTALSAPLRARVDLLGRVHRPVDQRAAHAHQRAQHRQVIDLLRELPRADQPRAGARQPGEVRRPAQLLHPLVRVEHRAQRDGCRQHVVAAQGPDRRKDAAVHGFKEMRRLQPVEQVVG